MNTLMQTFRGLGRRWMARFAMPAGPRRSAHPERDGWPDPALASSEDSRHARRRPWFPGGPRMKWKRDWKR